MKTISWITVSTLIIALSVGCAARSSVATATPMSSDLGSYSTLVLNLESSLEDDADVADSLRSLAGQIVAQVTGTGLFSDVRMGEVEEGDAETLLMRINVISLREVGSAARFIGGVFAGRAGTTMEVELVDGQSGNVLESQEITGESGSSAYAGGTSDALEQAANAVARWLSGAPAQ